VDVAFDDRTIGAQTTALGYALFAGQTDHALMNPCGDGRTQQSKGATEDREIWRSVSIEVGEAAGPTGAQCQRSTLSRIDLVLITSMT
jgi:hypothetical protein